MKLKIIAGLYRSIELLKFNDKNIKPSKNIVRSAMFNIIGKNICNANVLDLFAGSGSIGIEAISRGAKFVCFIDKNFNAINIIKKNLKKIKINVNNYKLINHDYKKALKKLTMDKVKFDIVIIDPPYKENEHFKIFNLLSESKLLNKRVIIIIESNTYLNLNLFNFAENKYLIKQKKYGRTILTIFKNI